jgi:hypothetical protein
MNVLQNKSVRKQILLTEEDAAKLESVSKGLNLSQNEIVNRGLTSYLKRFKQYFPEQKA